MPLTVKDGAMLSAGMWCVAASFVSSHLWKHNLQLEFGVLQSVQADPMYPLCLSGSTVFVSGKAVPLMPSLLADTQYPPPLLQVFYKRKKTLPFKVAYFLSWPVLGSAIISTFQPSEDKMIKASANRLRLAVPYLQPTGFSHSP